MAKFYAVKIGRKPGIYLTWDECKQQVDKFKGAVYKSFNTLSKLSQHFFASLLPCSFSACCICNSCSIPSNSGIFST